MPLKFYRILLSLSLLLLGSCAVKKENLFGSSSDKLADSLHTVLVVNDKGVTDQVYRIKANDQLAIRNLQNLEFGASAPTAGNVINTFLVDPDGTVNLPVLGKITVAGLSRSEATNKIQELYSKNLLKNPIIEVSVVNLKVTVLGEFSNKGNYLLERDDTDLVHIIGQAGGFTDAADLKKIKIIRGKRSDPEIIYVNLRDINSLSSPKLTLQNNDIIYAESRKRSSFKNVLTTIQPVTALLSSLGLLYTIFTR